MRDWSYARQVRRLLVAATSRTAAMALQGRTLVQIQDSLSLDDLRRATPVWAGTALDADWRETVQAL
jgi:hypothetical protein